MSVNTERPEYTSTIKSVMRNKAAARGERAIKAGKTEYLPLLPSMLENGQLTQEGAAEYDLMLNLVMFFNATGRTIEGLTGLVFRKDAQLDLPEQMEYLKDNADGARTSLRKSSELSVREGMVSPWSGLLVDHPSVDRRMTRAEAETNNIRPRILRYDFNQIINWDYEIIDNEKRLSLVVLKEVETIKKDRFTTDSKVIYRVLELAEEAATNEEGQLINQDGELLPDGGDPVATGNRVYTYSIYDDNGEAIQEPEPVIIQNQTVDRIPFFWVQSGAETESHLYDSVILNSDTLTSTIKEQAAGKAPVNDLVDVNLNHYKFFASYAYKEHVSSFPIFWGVGIGDKETPKGIGPGVFWSAESPDAQFGMMEPASDGGSLRQYLEDRKTEMAALGAEMLRPEKMAAETAESKRLDQQAQNSVVSNLAINVSEAYENALRFAALWLGLDDSEIVYRLNTDYFPDKLSSQMLLALSASLQAGEISYETFYRQLEAGEMTDPERDAEEEKVLIQNDELGLGRNNAANDGAEDDPEEE